MKEHHEELLQDVAEISHQYNELQELLQTKQTMIVDETIKSIEDVNQYFETYINELPEIQRKIIFDIERAKQDARVKREIYNE
jgi:flagellar hook-associated protein FlgK